MKKIFYTLVITLLFSTSFSQSLHHYYQNNGVTFIDENNDTMINPLGGGLKFPVFAGMDLNYDFATDLVLLDRVDNRVLTFINTGKGKEIKFTYQPQYEHLFPDTLASFIILVDFNNDKLLDMFTYSSGFGAGIAVYKNVGKDLSEIKFELEYPYLESYFKGNFGWKIPLPMFEVDIPAIVDFNQDGDLDILTFDPLGGAYLHVFNNYCQERYGTSDSLLFSNIDEYFGFFMENDSTNQVYLGQIPPVWLGAYKNYSEDYSTIDGSVQIDERPVKTRKKRHAGSTVVGNDIDGDGDMDLLIGDVEYPNIAFLENGKNDFQTFYDTIIKDNMHYPAYDKPIHIQQMPALFLIDVDRDGIKDLIGSPTDNVENDTFESLKQIWLYKNKGQNNNLDLEFQMDDFLQGEMVDLGGASTPAFFDYDADGDQDLFVSTIGNFKETFYKQDRIVLFENIGDATKPVFKKKDDDYLNLRSKGYRRMIITFADYDNDNDSDLVFGIQSGAVIFYKNTAGQGNLATFERDTSMHIKKVYGGYSSPAFADLDQDGLNDMLLGQFFGKLTYYRNTGTPGKAEFTLEKDTFGGIVFDKGDHYSTPALADLDTNGHMDLVLASDTYRKLAGIREGKLYFYKDITKNLDSTFTSIDTLIYDSVNMKVIHRSLGLRLRPAITTLDADSLPDIMLGSLRGGLMFFGTHFDTAQVSIKEYEVPRISFNVFPNPAETHVTLVPEGKVNDLAIIRLTDLLGKTIMEKQVEYRASYTIDLKGLPEGLYLINTYSEKGKLISQNKIIKH